MKMKICKYIFFLAAVASCVFSCQKKTPDEIVSEAYGGLVINEIAAHDEISGADSWVEILNTSAGEVSLEGLGLYLKDEYLNDKCLWSAGTGKLAAGERIVVSTASEPGLSTGIISNAEFVLRLGTGEGSVDKFVRSEIMPEAQYNRGSYQRIPDGGETWRNMTYSTKGRANEIFDWKEPLPNAIWMWSSHMEPMMADDAAIMKEYWRLGYRHLLLNSAAFTNRPQEAVPFMEKAEEIGFAVHGWIQAFYKGGAWNVPIDKEKKTVKEEVFADMRELGRLCIEDFGVKGLHLDYIRWPSKASQYNFTKEVNSVAAVNRACRETRELCDSYDEGLVTSAALMPEPNTTSTYAQDPSQMGKYIQILMPMCYRYSYGYSDAGLVNVMNWFCKNSADAAVWSGLQTYDKSTTGLSADAILSDIMAYRESNATGIVLFRFGLGTFPDVNNIWNTTD